MKIITTFPDGDTWQMDGCNPFSQSMELEAFRDIFSMERSLKNESSEQPVRSEEAQVLKWFWLQSAAAEMPGIRHEIN